MRRIPYQGYLEQNGVPVNGVVDLCLQLWNDPSATAAVNQLWSEQQNDVQVSAGRFAIRLGADQALDGIEGAANLYLTVAVRAEATPPANAATGACADPTLPSPAYTPLSGRQQLGSAAFAISAKQGVPGQDFIVGGNIIIKAP